MHIKQLKDHFYFNQILINNQSIALTRNVYFTFKHHQRRYHNYCTYLNQKLFKNRMTTFLYIKTTLVSFIYLFNSGDRAITMVPWRWWYLVEPQYGHQPPHSWKGYHAGVNGWCWGVNPCMQQKNDIGRHPFFSSFIL